MEKPKETLVYGGAFNPPTLAHQAILQACIDHAEPREADVWLLPSADRRDKTIGVSRERRLAFCAALVEDVVSRTVDISISTAELASEKITETYRTVDELAAGHPDRKFVWVFGSDSFQAMPMWSRGSWMQSHLPMLIVDRPGFPKVEIGANAAWLAVRADMMSSTELRRRIESGESYDELVGPHVAALLEQTVVS